MFRRAQSMANDTGKSAYVIYDDCERSYYAVTELEKDDILIKEIKPNESK